MATYKESGVDISAGEETIRRIKPLVRNTFTKGVLTDIGAFGAFFAPDWSDFDDPILVSSVDGVGTKLRVAVDCGRHDTVGQDLVNHCVNDIAVCGASPMFFMDYFATGRLDPDIATSVISGFAVACRENECALIGGELAEMPGMYQADDYDLAGTIVGIVDRNSIVDGRDIQAGDTLIGLPSNGLHTNGYSLARHVLLGAYSVDDRPHSLGGCSLGDELLRVHRSYLKAIRALCSTGLVRGMSHVTGGGIEGNTQRVIPEGLGLTIHWGTWKEPAVFSAIRELGQVPESDMQMTFNLGIGLVVIVGKSDTDRILTTLTENGEAPIVIGSVNHT